LDEGSTPLMLDEDGPTIADATAPTVSEGDRTYKTLSKLVILVSTNANMHSLQVRVYQHKDGLRQRAKQSPGIYPGAFHLVSTNEDPRLLAEEVTK
jgi:hypothetical protein